MKVLELWRYPVKSLQGESLEFATFTSGGLEGDRRFALFDIESGLGLTARRFPQLLFASARIRDGGVEISLPDGSLTDDDNELSAWLGRPVTLRSATDRRTRTYENPADFENETTSSWTRFNGSLGAFHDSKEAQISLVSRKTIDGWDHRRFRANVLLDGQDEDSLVGTTVALGDAILDVKLRIGRCVMTTRPQPGGIKRDLNVLRTIKRERGGHLAIGALVVRSGKVRVGDTLR